VARAATLNRRQPVVPKIHLADGGYFDNFGIVTIVELLFATSSTLKENKIDTVILLDISPWSRETAEQAAQTDERYERLLIQATAPFATLYGARGTSQAVRAASEIRLLQDTLRQQGIELVRQPVFMDKYIARDGFNVPLSWHLDREEQCVLRDARDMLRIVLQSVVPEKVLLANDELSLVNCKAVTSGKQSKLTGTEVNSLSEDWKHIRQILNGN